MNIGIFTDTYEPNINGVVTSIRTFKQELEKQGQNVYIFSPSENLKYQALPEKKTWHLPSVQFYGEKRYRFVFPFFFHMKELAELPLDIVHTQTPLPVGALGYFIARRKKLPIVHTYHTRYHLYAHYLKLPEKLVRWATRTGIKRIMNFVNKHDAIVAPSIGLKRELEGFGVKKSISVIPTGVDIPKVIALSQQGDPEALLARFGIGPHDPFILTASRLGNEKNIDFMLEAMRRIAAKRPDVKFLIAGDGNIKDDLRKKADVMGIGSSVVLTGFLTHPELFSILPKAKVFVFSSLTETQGLVITEAMALGVPVVAIKAMGIEDIMDGDLGGFLVDGSADLFAEKVLALLGDPALHAQKSGEARAQAENFSAKNMAAKLLQLYQNVIASKGGISHGQPV